jgi:hypothetical protein
MTPTEASKFIKADLQVWTQVIRAAGLTPLE